MLMWFKLGISVMGRTASKPRAGVATYLQIVAMIVVSASALAAAGATLAAASGYLPFLILPLQFGETLYPHGGIVIQTGLVVLLLTVAAAMPSGFRVLQLERTHRDFSITMSDVADAYRACHAADRAGTFTLSSEFDAVKERIQFLRKHPDLGSFEPEVIEVAAQMSHTSRDLAEIYSDENVARARGFLQQRQEEIELFEQRLEKALAQAHELRRYREAVEIEEDAMENRLARFEEEFGDLLRELGFVRRPGIVALTSKATAAE